MTSAALLLHPVRLRIIQSFLGDRVLTTAQLAEELNDVPTGSLYRHVALLTKAGVLQVVAERRVRAVVERSYALRILAAQIQPNEAAVMTPDQHLQAFLAYVAGMLGDAERYLTTGTPDPVRDGAAYRMAALWLTDAEYADMLQELRIALVSRLANAPAKGRRRRMLYTILLPAPELAPLPPSKSSGGRAVQSTRKKIT